MSRNVSESRNTHKFSVRLDEALDADLIEWLDAQPHGKRSEAIRDLMRDGLRMCQLEANLMTTVRQAVAEALAGLQIMSPQQGPASQTDNAEAIFGERLDRMLDKFD